MGYLIFLSYSFLFLNLIHCKFLLKSNTINILFFLLITAFFFLLFGFRDGVILSTDYQNYVEMFDSFPDGVVKAINRVEPFFALMILYYKKIGGDATSFLLIISLMFSIMVSLFCYRMSPHYSIILLLVFTCSPFYFNFASNTIRQGLAFGLLLIGMVFIEKRKRLGLICYFFAVLTHFSAIFPVGVLFFYRKILVRQYILSLVLLLSPILFFIDLLFVFKHASSIFDGIGMFSKLMVNFESGERLVTGRLYYLAGFVLCLTSIAALDKIEKLKDFSVRYIRMMISVLCASVVIFPIVTQFSFFVRFISYGFAFIPVLTIVLMRIFIKERDWLYVSYLLYITLGMLLVFQLDYYMI